ncbi:MAG: MBL fold metallo-hydrolase [Gammaproteobacteria bacterium]|nr:MBL fold metallo-hydrolase [Gammaproteobacteria bacterium]
MATLKYLGATGQVTGSCYLIETAHSRVLLECGMFQGDAQTEETNRRPFAFDPRGIDAVVLSHAHLDHSGLLPRLAREGFRGPVFATPATHDLIALMLKDAAHLEEKDTEWENKIRRRAGRPAIEPLYTFEDVETLLGLRQPVAYDVRYRLSEDIEFRFRDAGHILGSAIVEAWIRRNGSTAKLVFSGDLGNKDSFLLRDPTRVEEADVVLMESTYGDRDHRAPGETVEEFKQALQAAARSGGNVLIPAFAVGRTQEILYLLGRFYQAGELPQRAVFLDSPMAIAATAIYHDHMTLFNRQELAELHRADAANLLAWLPVLRTSRTPEESMAINQITGGAIIIAGSGMCNGGRIRHHLKYNLWRSEAHVIFVGFQGRGTPGRALVDGARRIHLLGGEVAVKARIHTLGGFSAHAGQRQLLEWLRGFDSRHSKVYLVHGEPEKAEVLAGRILDDLGYQARIPRLGETIDL